MSSLSAKLGRSLTLAAVIGSALPVGAQSGPYGVVQTGVVPRRRTPPVLPPVNEIPTQAQPTAPPAGVTWAVRARLGRVIARASEVYRQPDVRSRWLAALPQGQYLAVVAQGGGWVGVMMADGGPGYLPEPNVELLPYEVRTVSSASQSDAPAGQAEQPPTAPAELPQLPALTSPLAGGVISRALQFEGVPYQLGGNDRRGLDCSGLVKVCFASAGVELPRKASEQASVGRGVPLDQLQPGDRLYFSVKRTHDHTGIYLGNGFFIHASRSRGRVGIDHLSSGLYGSSLNAARRL